MNQQAKEAIDNHKRGYSCSAAILCAFSEKAGLSETDAKRVAAPFAGGRMGKCGAVLSAEYVLRQIFGESSEAKLSEFENKFIAEDKGSVMCADLRGKVPGSCRACVTDAAMILESML